MIELWSSNHDAYSHRCRIVIEEKDLGLEKGKGMGIRVRLVDINKKPEDLASINPRNQVPVLVDRDLRLYESNIINEYLDERFPHPQLMPLGVADKGKARLLLHELDWNFYSRMDMILASKPGKQQDLQRKLLAEALLGLSQRMGRTKYFTGNEFTMVDVALAPLLWRLKSLGVNLPPKAAPLLKYADVVFTRPSFKNSLLPPEQEMRR